MKNLLKKMLVVAVVAMAAVVPAQAQLRFGVKAGVAINKLSFNEDAFETDNRTGFTGGIMLEYQVPIVGLCIDGSVLYAHRSGKLTAGDDNSSLTTFKRDYIDIPVNLKYKFGILGTSGIFAPFIFTGPDFAILVSDKENGSVWENKSFNTSWNVGFGAELLSHLQIAASYGFGLSKAVNNAIGSNVTSVNGKDKCWTITAAYLF